VDSNSNVALEDFNKNFNISLGKMQETFERKISEMGNTLETQQKTLEIALSTQNENLLKSIEQQQRIIAEKLQDTTKFVDELNKVGDKIASITRLEKAMNEQNGEISDLSNSIKELAKKAGGNPVDFSIPRWTKIAIIAGSSVVVVFCFFELIIKILSLIGIAI
jgi:DNA anti-recombination protein RmuC